MAVGNTSCHITGNSFDCQVRDNHILFTSCDWLLWLIGLWSPPKNPPCFIDHINCLCRHLTRQSLRGTHGASKPQNLFNSGPAGDCRRSGCFISFQEIAGQYSNAASILNGFFHLRFFGASGVHIFFVISGFIMIVVSAHQFRLPGAPTKFFKRRLIRIVPVYWFYTSLMLLLVCLPYTLKQSTFDIAYTIKSYLFIPAVCPSTDKIVPLLARAGRFHTRCIFIFFLRFF